MKALSIRQPWAWLIVNGWKNIENREWPTRFRGRFLVHASQGMTRAEYEAARIFVAGFAPILANNLMPHPADLERGGLVGEATLLDCVRRHNSEWFCGEWGFVLADAEPSPFLPYKGRLGFFDVDDLDQGLGASQPDDLPLRSGADGQGEAAEIQRPTAASRPASTVPACGAGGDVQ